MKNPTLQAVRGIHFQIARNSPETLTKLGEPFYKPTSKSSPYLNSEMQQRIRESRTSSM